MERTKQQNWFKRHLGIVAVVAVVIIAGLATAVVLLASSKHSVTTKQPVTSAKTNTTSTAPDTSQYKLAACTSGATQTIDNASYVIGTDFAAGSYKIVSQTGDIGWTNINVYNTKAEYIKQGSPSVEQGVADQSFEPDNGTTTYTKLTDGQFMQIDSDPATFTCE